MLLSDPAKGQPQRGGSYTERGWCSQAVTHPVLRCEGLNGYRGPPLHRWDVPTLSSVPRCLPGYRSMGKPTALPHSVHEPS